MADAVVIPVFDNEYIRHYAYILPDMDSRRTYCGKDAATWESAEDIEQLRQSVQSFTGNMRELSSKLRREENVKIANFLQEGMNRLINMTGDFFKLQRITCSSCNERLNEDGNTSRR